MEIVMRSNVEANWRAYFARPAVGGGLKLASFY